MQLRKKIDVIAENLRKVTRQKFVAIREGDHKQAHDLHGIQLELDLKLHLLESKLQKSNTAPLVA
jgi:hypothetical protein|tara:strand:+ start:3028 stop:3222 length:195 start_codon:yes stop_codon:yes gene_type:complete